MYDYNRTLERGFSIESFHFLFQSICTHFVNSGKSDTELFKLVDYKWNSSIDASGESTVSLNTFRILINKTFENYSEGIVKPIWDYEVTPIGKDITVDPRVNVMVSTVPFILSFLVESETRVSELDSNSKIIIDARNICNDFYISVCNNGGGAGVYFKETAVVLLLKNPIVVSKLKLMLAKKIPDKNIDMAYGTIAPEFKLYLKGNKLENENSLGIALIVDKLKQFVNTPQFYGVLNGMRTTDYIKDSDGSMSQSSELDILNALELNPMTEDAVTRNFMELSRLANDCSARFLSSEKTRNISNTTKRVKVRVGSAFEILQARYAKTILLRNKVGTDLANRYIKHNYYTLCETDSDKAKVNHFIELLDEAFDLIEASGSTKEYSNLSSLISELEYKEISMGSKINNNLFLQLEGSATSKFRVSNDDGIYLPEKSRALLLLKLVVVYNRTITLFEGNKQYKFYKLSSIAGNKKYRLDSFKTMNDYIIASKVDSVIESEKTFEFSFVDKNTGDTASSSLKNLSTFGEAYYDVMSFKVIPKLDNNKHIENLNKLTIDLNTLILSIKLWVDKLVDPKGTPLETVWYDTNMNLTIDEVNSLKRDYFNIPFLKRYKEAIRLVKNNVRINRDMASVGISEIIKIPSAITNTISSFDSIMGDSNCLNLFLNIFNSIEFAVKADDKNKLRYTLFEYLNSNFAIGEDLYDVALDATIELLDKFLPCLLLVYSVVYSVNCAMSDLSKSSDLVSGLDRGYNEVFNYEELRKGTNYIDLSSVLVKDVMFKEVTTQSGALSKVFILSPHDNKNLRFSYRTLVDFKDNDFKITDKLKDSFGEDIMNLFNILAKQLSMPIGKCLDIIKRTETNYSEYLSQFNIDIDNGLKSKRIMLNKVYATVEAHSMITKSTSLDRFGFEPPESNLRLLDNIRYAFDTQKVGLPIIKQWISYLLKPYFKSIGIREPEEITSNVSIQAYIRFFTDELNDWNKQMIEEFDTNFVEDISGFLMDKETERFITFNSAGEKYYLHKNGYLFRGETSNNSINDVQYMIL